MPFQSMVPVQGMMQSPFGSKQPVSQADVEDLRAQLERMGLKDSWLDQANDWRGGLVEKRDNLSTDLMRSVFGKSGASADAGDSGSALQSAAGSALKSGAMSSL